MELDLEHLLMMAGHDVDLADEVVLDAALPHAEAVDARGALVLR